MSGQLTYWDKTQRDDESFFVTVTGLQQARQHAVDKHTHVSFYFADGNAMHYRDIRQFGKWRLYRSEAFHEAREFWQLGLEPFDKRLYTPKVPGTLPKAETSDQVSVAEPDLCRWSG